MDVSARRPRLVILAGPNGAGKTTLAQALLPPRLLFVNADEVARRFAAVGARAVDSAAGRATLARIDQLVRARADFALETTLSGRSLAQRLRHMRAAG